MPIIEVDHLTKEFQLGELESFKSALRNQWRRVRGQPQERLERFKALNDVSFKIEPGEVVGIIGHNGAGKSTLLKLLAGISQPTYGRIAIHGRVAPLIEVGAGFVGQLTGRENVYLNGAILGMTKKEINRRFDEIVDFAEMEKFIDTPVKRYSSGMRVKLAFAVATSVDAEILIVDEVLAVGDLAFQRKCFDRMEALIKTDGRTVLLVSHNIRQVERMCSRVILLDSGGISQDGKPNSVCRSFYEYTNQRVAKFHGNILDHANGNKWASGEIELLHIQAFGDEKRATSTVKQHHDLHVLLRVRVNTTVRNVTFGIGLHTSDFIYLVTDHSHLHFPITALDPGEHDIACTFKSLPFNPGEYGMRVGIGLGQAVRTVFYAENLLRLQVLPADEFQPSWQEGLLSLSTTWQVSSESDDQSMTRFFPTEHSEIT